MSDDLLTTFIDSRYTDELKREIFTSLNLFDFYEYDKGYDPLYALVHSSSQVSVEDLSDHLFENLVEQLDIVLEQHGIKLNELATLEDRNKILYGLALFQSRENYEVYARILESSDEDVLQVGYILEDIVQMDAIHFVSILQSMTPRLTIALSALIEDKDQSISEEPSEHSAQIVRLLKSLTLGYGKEHLAATLLEAGFMVGAKLDNYLVFVDDAFLNNDSAQTALNILSLMYLSEDCYQDPIGAYRERSELWMDSLQTINEVEEHILTMISKVNELRGAQDASDRLS